jgi:Tol biopolymer transport system component
MKTMNENEPARSHVSLGLCLYAVLVVSVSCFITNGKAALAWDNSTTTLIGPGAYPSISGNGRFAVFQRYVDNGVTAISYVVLYDRLTARTTQVSVNSRGIPGNNGSENGSISGDGRFITFESDATNLVAGDTNDNVDVFVRDRLARKTTRVSISSRGVQANGESRAPSISGNGRFVVFYSYATNLAADGNPDGGAVFIHDRQISRTKFIALKGENPTSGPTISYDGRFVAFSSRLRLTPDAPDESVQQVFVYDNWNGRIKLASVGPYGVANQESYNPSISANGRFVAFQTYADNLVPRDTDFVTDVFVRDVRMGTITRVSVATGGAQGNEISSLASISGSGRFIAFHSRANNLVKHDTNDVRDVFVHDRQTGMTKRVSLYPGNMQLAAGGSQPSISADGRFVAFMDGAIPDELASVYVRGLAP